jgi:hypothetical protein
MIPGTPFFRPEKPESSRQLIRWILAEPILVRKNMNSLSDADRTQQFLRSFPFLILISLMLWLLLLSILSALDLPSEFSRFYENEFSEGWDAVSGFFPRMWMLIRSGGFWLLLSWVIVFLSGWVFTAAFQWKESVIFGLFASILSALVFATGNGLLMETNVVLQFVNLGLVFGIAISSLFISMGDPVKSVNGGLVSGFVASMFLFFIAWSLYTLKIAVISSAAFSAAFFFMYFRIPFWLVYQIQILLNLSFTRNPFMWDGVIWFRIWATRLKLTQLAKDDPDRARDFIEFLLRYRPLQRYLSQHLQHAVTSGEWRRNILVAEILKPPSIAKDLSELRFSDEWKEKLVQVRNMLIESDIQSNIGLKADAFREYLEEMKNFRRMTLNEPSRWNHYYFDTLDRWIIESESRLSDLLLRLQTEEPVTRNVYRRGEPLQPAIDEDVFVGRDDLRDKLSKEILTARSLPMFLIQGQRRVGKTSLLNFLPMILGSRFKVVYQDLQHVGHNVLFWLKDLRQAVNRTMGITDEEVWEPPEDWGIAWRELRAYLEKVSGLRPYKLILALDEYEALHYHAFDENRKQARLLLGAIRSFTQHQNQVVFLFVGSRFFYELHNPNWSEYFPHVRTLKVDYLPEDATIRLIQKPNPTFNIRYPDGLPQEIFRLTQGHPALVQMICYAMVNLANQANRSFLTPADLEKVMAEEVMDKGNGVMNVFWDQFCGDNRDKDTVRAILKKTEQPFPDRLRRLMDHGFVVEEGDEVRLRVPIFELWLLENDPGAS